MALDGSDKKTVVVIDLMIHIVIFVILVITKIDLVYLCHFVNPVLYSAFLK